MNALLTELEKSISMLYLYVGYGYKAQRQLRTALLDEIVQILGQLSRVGNRRTFNIKQWLEKYVVAMSLLDDLSPEERRLLPRLDEIREELNSKVPVILEALADLRQQVSRTITPIAVNADRIEPELLKVIDELTGEMSAAKARELEEELVRVLRG